MRGMIVSKPVIGVKDPLELIQSYPFTRFFNKDEVHADEINIPDSEMIEKLDGSMVGVYFPKGTSESPEFHTRKMSSRNESDMNYVTTSFHGRQFNFLPEIQKYVKKINFSNQDVVMTYVFEFIHEVSYVVTQYNPEKYGLHLIGGRNMRTFEELSENELDHTARILNVRRPERWDATNDEEEIKRMLDEIREKIPNFEGYVFRYRKTGKRIKIKDPRYVQIHHMLNDLSFKNLIPKIIEGEIEEILAYFPHAKDRVEMVVDKIKKWEDNVFDSVLKWKRKNLTTKKELALAIFDKDSEVDKTVSSFIMRTYDLPLDEIKKYIESQTVRIALNNTKRFIELVGLKIEPDQTDTGCV